MACRGHWSGVARVIFTCDAPIVPCAYVVLRVCPLADAFLSKTKQLVGSYHEAKAIPEAERVIFESVSDNIGDLGGVKSTEMQRQ